MPHLALALIEEDLGEPTAKRIAQQLVVYHRRPGGRVFTRLFGGSPSALRRSPSSAA